MKLSPIQIFKPGRHTASNGLVMNFSAADLQAAVAAYDPAKSEAPIVIGHPKTDAPAYGWVKSLAFADGALNATPDQIEPAFAEAVRAGRYKKVSASFYLPDAAANPVPGSLYLRHVGFLGAQPPAVKGLRQAEFADGDEGVIEFGDWGDVQNASLWRRMREWMIAQFGLDVADKNIPDYQVQSLEDAARTPPAAAEAVPSMSSYSEHSPEETLQMTAEELAAQKAVLDKQKADQDAQAASFAEREAKLKADETARQRGAIVEFADGLVKAGKLLPANKAGLVEFMAGISGDGVIEFGEGDKKVSKPAADWFRDYLTNCPTLVEFTEVGKGDGTTAVDNSNAEDIAKRAVEFQEAEAKAGREISASAAVKHVTTGGK